MTKHLSVPFVFAMAMATALPCAALAQDRAPQEGAVSSTASELHREDRTLTATVLSVDQANRLVTLRGPKGKEVTIQAGPEVQNLGQLKAGDQVTTHYQSALAVQIMPAHSAHEGVDVQSGAASAAPGQKPGLKAGSAVTVTSKLTAVDLKNHTVTLTGADGKERVIEVKDPERQKQLGKLKVGDMVVMTYVEALAISVTPKGGAKAKS